jgi:hypothetical protein
VSRANFLEVNVMRFSQWLLGGATAAAIAGAIASGCGGSTNNNTPVDSGTDVNAADSPSEAAKEAAAETGPADAGPDACTVDADLSTLQVPDASIGDSGATTAECYSCIETTCSTQLTACNGDCTCKTDIVQFIACVGGGGQILTCGAPLVGGDPAALALLVCTGGSAAAQLGGSGPGCLKQCGVSLPEGGAGEGGAGEGGTGEGGGGEAGGDAAGE